MFDSKRLDFASLLPADQNKSFWQQLIMSQEHYFLFGLYPAAYITDKKPILATAYSSLIAFRKSAIKKIGGFEIVKKSPLEDLDIANKAKQSGLMSEFYSASDLAVSQNRSEFNQLREYNEQRLYPSLHFNMPVSLALVSLGAFIIVFPIALLTILLIMGVYEGTILLAVACALMLVNRIIIMSKSKQSITSALLYPLGGLVLLTEILSSMLKYELKKPRWEKRREI
jgi:GT2 family glycosyltransferase